MTQELKVYLNLFAKYLTQTIGCDEASFSGDWYGLNLYDENFSSCNGSERSPIPMLNVLNGWLENNKKEIWDNQEGEDPYALRIVINGEDRTISLYEEYSEYFSEPEEITTIDVEGEPELKEIINHYCEKEEICRGQIRWDFSGGGDSGYIEESGRADFKDGNIQLTSQLEDMGYRMLSDYGGWEINEGSQGDFTLDLDTEELTLTFSWNTEESKENMVLQQKF